MPFSKARRNSISSSVSCWREVSSCEGRRGGLDGATHATEHVQLPSSVKTNLEAVTFPISNLVVTTGQTTPG
jgi:hypothetical protein